MGKKEAQLSAGQLVEVNFPMTLSHDLSGKIIAKVLQPEVPSKNFIDASIARLLGYLVEVETTTEPVKKFTVRIGKIHLIEEKEAN